MHTEKPYLIPEPKMLTMTGNLCSPDAEVSIQKNGRFKDEEYRIHITSSAISIEAGSPNAAQHAGDTLLQIFDQYGDDIPTMELHDWPDFATRGVMYDVTRGRVPKRSELMHFIDILALHKVNQIQLYIEHAFRFEKHPSISRGASPLTPDDILALDIHCIERGIDLIPAFASFGHMSNILTKPKYRHLAEDYGTGKYAVDTSKTIPSWFQDRKGWSLAPANPETYEFIDELYSELLPCFSSGIINVCCDEVYDMGLGQSRAMCRKKGKAGLFAYHVKQLRDIAREHGCRIMIWGDMLRHYPEITKMLPRDITILDWAYDSTHNFNSIKKFTSAKRDTIACPGTSSWASLFPRLPEAQQNISGFARAAKKYDADGVLTTDWGDGGHYNFLEFSWHGLLSGAELSWNADADINTFTQRFTSSFLNSKSPELAEAIDELGAIAELSIAPWYQSIWQHILFAEPANSVFKRSKEGLTAAFARKTIKKLIDIRKTFVKYARKKDVDPTGTLSYWIYAVDSMICSARKLALLGPRATDSPEARSKLRKDLRKLARDFETLWLQRNRKSGIDITLDRLKSAAGSL